MLGLDPDQLETAEHRLTLLESTDGAKAWKDIWGAGQGIGAIDRRLGTADLVARLRSEYQQALRAPLFTGSGTTALLEV
ncbi:MAG: hypothetical protein EON52_04730 [Actinomycetales bacterium]|nr:MAG: hypothetical protein EON52_04730 [Actinomycetales bacterium]